MLQLDPIAVVGQCTLNMMHGAAQGMDRDVLGAGCRRCLIYLTPSHDRSVRAGVSLPAAELLSGILRDMRHRDSHETLGPLRV